MAGKADHVKLSVLYDFIVGNAALEPPARKHIQVCARCRSDIVWLQWLGDFGVQERRYEPLSWAIANVENFFRLKKPAVVTIARHSSRIRSRKSEFNLPCNPTRRENDP